MRLLPPLITSMLLLSCASHRVAHYSWAIGNEAAILAHIKTHYAKWESDLRATHPNHTINISTQCPSALEVAPTGHRIRIHYPSKPPTTLAIDHFTGTFTLRLNASGYKLVAPKVDVITNDSGKVLGMTGTSARQLEPFASRYPLVISASDL